MKLDEWDNPFNDKEMSLDEFIEIIIEGFEQCEGFCESRHKYGCDRCECVRSTFATPRHYEAFIKLRENYLSMVDAAFTARHIKENINDKDW